MIDKHARYGPIDRYGAPPAAGMCLSVFARVRAGGRALVGRPAAHPEWSFWMPSWQHYEKADLDEIMAGRLIPATYMLEGEAPTKTLDRIMREQLGIKRYTASERPLVFSSNEPSGWYPGHSHWDVAFVYDVTAAKPAKTPPLWRELAWKTPREVKAKEFGWNADLAKWLKIAQK